MCGKTTGIIYAGKGQEGGIQLVYIMSGDIITPIFITILPNPVKFLANVTKFFPARCQF